MHELPGITADPVVSIDGGWCLRIDGGVVPLRIGQDGVTAFIPGWRPVFVYTGFSPILLLQFSSDAGEAACWIVDADGLRLGGSVGELDPHAVEALRAVAVPVVRRLVGSVLVQPVVALDPGSRAFLLLPEGLRREIAQLCAASALPEARRVLLNAVPDQWESGWELSRTHVEALLAAPFQDRVLMVAQDGMLSWPSPVDGRTLVVQGSLCSDDFRFAYRLVDAEHGLVCYPIVSDHHSITLGLYVPALSLVLIRDGGLAGVLNVYLPSMTDWLVPLVCRFAGALEGYFQCGAGRVASILRGWPSTHLGHQLWNELTGIDHFLRSARGPYLPDWIVPGAETEIWGPVDEVFPQLLGRIDRSAPNPDFAVNRSYATGVCLVRVTSNYVSADLRASLRRSVEADPVYGEVKQIVAGRTRPDAPVILLGLRVENRTLADLLDFCEELLEYVARVFPGSVIVIDGHNSGHEGGVIVSHHELRAPRSPLVIERQIAAHLRRLQVGRDVTVVDTLGSSIRTSLAWCEQATCFFSIWGASLAKYRWACNKRGLVISSKWNLQQRADLHIYDSPAFMETPSHLEFVDADFVNDLPDAPLLVDFGPDQPWFANFYADYPSVFSLLLQVINYKNDNENVVKDAMNYVSCAPTILYRDGGFFETPELLARLSDPAQTPGDECRMIGELYPPYGYARPTAEFHTDDAGFRKALEAHYEYVNRTCVRGAASAVVCLAFAFLNNNVLYTKSAAGIRIVFETYRSVDRPYVPQIDPSISPSIEELSDPAVLDLFLGSAGSPNYGHWLVDDLPRARAVETLQTEAAGRPVRIWITSASPVMDRVRTESLARICAGLGQIEVRLLKPNQVYAFRNLYYVTPVSCHPALKSPDAMAALQSQAATSGARLFVTRRANHSRGLLNNDVIQKRLEGRGFTTIDVEAISFTQQVNAFASANIIVGCMGAAMVNCVFAPKGTTTLYLAPQGWLEPFYWDAAAVLTHRYLAIYGPVRDLTRDAHVSEYSIEPAALDQLLDGVLDASI